MNNVLRWILLVCTLAIGGCSYTTWSGISASTDKDEMAMREEIRQAKLDPTLDDKARNERLFWLLRLSAGWSLPLTQQLVDQGVPVNYPNGDKTFTDAYSPLHTAIEKGQLDIAHYLLEQGADPNGAIGAIGMTFYPLSEAVSRENLAMVGLLLEFGANPNVNDTNNGIALKYATYRNNEALIKLLRDSGAVLEPNEEQELAHLQSDNSRQQAALQVQLALKQDDWTKLDRILKLFPEQQTNQDTNGRNLVDQALGLGSIDCFTNLQEKYDFSPPSPDQVNEAIIAAIQKGKRESLNRILKLMPPIGDLLAAKREAIIRQDQVSLRILLDYNQKVDGSLTGQMTLLQLAVSRPSLQLTELLLQHKAILQQISQVEPLTPLALSIRQRQFVQTKLLLAHGAKPDSESPDEASATFLAIREEQDTLALSLLKLEENITVNRLDTFYGLSLQKGLPDTTVWLESSGAKEDIASLRKRKAAQIAREERRLAEEKRDFEREERRELASMRNNSEAYIDDSNTWVGFATDLINETSRIAQQNIEDTQRIRRQQQAQQKAQLDASRRVWEREYNEKIRKFNEQKAALLSISEQRNDTINQQREQQLGKVRDMRETERQKEAEKQRIEQKEIEKQEREQQKEAERLAKIEQKEREKQERERQKEAEQIAQNKAKEDYLSKLLAGARLGVKKCSGAIAVSGVLPKVTPKIVECRDVHFRVVCPASSRSETGVIKTFIGMNTGCAGDYGKISSDLGCKVEELRATAIKVTQCEF